LSPLRCPLVSRCVGGHRGTLFSTATHQRRAPGDLVLTRYEGGGKWGPRHIPWSAHDRGRERRGIGIGPMPPMVSMLSRPCETTKSLPPGGAAWPYRRKARSVCWVDLGAICTVIVFSRPNCLAHDVATMGRDRTHQATPDLFSTDMVRDASPPPTRWVSATAQSHTLSLPRVGWESRAAAPSGKRSSAGRVESMSFSGGLKRS
jgi:hypothetical protein